MAKKYKNLGFGVLENLGNGENDLGKPGISTLWGRGHPALISAILGTETTKKYVP